MHEDAALLRAADLIGQLGDPHYLRKANALYHEFEEIGLNGQLGYGSPSDLVDKYPQFYWSRVSPYIQAGIRYLNVTASGRQWINGLYSNVFRAEHELRLNGAAALIEFPAQPNGLCALGASKPLAGGGIFVVAWAPGCKDGDARRR